MSWRETFLLSLLEVDTEAESVTGASVLGFFCGSVWESCEICVAGSCLPCKGHIKPHHASEKYYKQR